MNVVSNLSFDSEEDEINDLLMLVPQNAESADESGTIDIEDTTESSTSSILQNEDTDTGPALNPLHTQSILLQVPAALHGCSVEQILVEKAGTILCLVLKWKQDGDDKVIRLIPVYCTVQNIAFVLLFYSVMGFIRVSCANIHVIAIRKS